MQQLLVLCHVLAAIVWVGGGIYAVIQSHRALDTGEGLTVIVDQQERSGASLFAPAAVVVLISGVAIVLTTSAWSFGQTFVWASLSLALVSIAIGAAFYGPAWRQMRVLLESDPNSQELVRLRRRVQVTNGVDTLILLTVVALMVTKPGL